MAPPTSAEERTVAVVRAQLASSLATTIRARVTGFDEEVDGRPVLDLGAEHGRPVHERGERQERRDDQAVEQHARGPGLLGGVLAPEAVDERDEHREEREEPEQDRPPAREHLADRQAEDDPGHRLTR